MEEYKRTASQTSIDPGSSVKYASLSERLILSNEIMLASPRMTLTLRLSCIQAEHSNRKNFNKIFPICPIEEVLSKYQEWLISCFQMVVMSS